MCISGFAHNGALAAADGDSAPANTHTTAVDPTLNGSAHKGAADPTLADPRTTAAFLWLIIP